MTAVMTAPAPTQPKTWKWNTFTRDSTRQTVMCLLWTLHELGGTIEDKSGRCGRALVKAARDRGYIPNHIHDPFVGSSSAGSLSQLLHELDSGNYAGTISRHCNGKRTYKITLLIDEAQMPPRPLPVTTRKVEPAKPPVEAVKPKIGDTRPAPGPQRIVPKAEHPAPVKPAPAPQPVTPAAVDDSETVDVGPAVELPKGLDIAPPLDEPAVEPVLPPLVMVEGNAVDILLQIQQLAMQATLVVATDIGGPNPSPATDDRDDIAERLAVTLEENNRLRRKANELTETVRSKVKETEALQKALLIAQGNLRKIQEAYGQAGDLEHKLNVLNGTQRAIASRPEPAIAGRRQR